MIIKTDEELQYLKESGEIARNALKVGIEAIKPGVKTIDINNIVHSEITKKGAKPAFLNYDAGDGPYPYSCCICVNHELVHSLPGERVINKGDIVTIDLGVIYYGFYTDTSYTVEVETNNETFFLNTGKKALKKAISMAVAGKKTGDIGFAMEDTVKRAGFNVSKDLVGHGIGKNLHEAPQIPCYGRRNTGDTLIKGHVLAIEIMYMKGQDELVMSKDGFGIETKDYSLSAQFEHTVMVTDKKPFIIV